MLIRYICPVLIPKMFQNKYQITIGLEVHIQLKTESKIFSSESTKFGEAPNTQVGIVSAGLPGTLPKLNKNVVYHAVKLGLACHSKITFLNYFDRKNYFYADLPKGYQITQDRTPVCVGGKIKIDLKNGIHKEIPLNRIHIEEDAGKSIHDQDLNFSLVDLNRAGVPLLELVTEPTLQSAEETVAFLSELRKLVRYLDICDANMEEGAFRCDVNISMNKSGASELGKKVEIKNMNSLRNIQKAIEFETIRQAELLENNQVITQETRGFDVQTDRTFSLRKKELANDYRYFPEPDLAPFEISSEFIETIKGKMPELPWEKFERYQAQYGVSKYDAQVLSEEKAIADYFETICSHCSNFKSAANWMMGSIKNYLNETGTDILQFPISSFKIGELIASVDNGLISNTIATQKIFPILIENPSALVFELAQKNDLLQENDTSQMENWVTLAIQQFPDKVIEYKKGKKGLIGLFMGEVMKISQGKADPKISNELLNKALNN
jgi:aspartyl-tRNA(Asn)/glutamyl-tRNA(Gln) amidotransferase subunit B